MKGKHALALAVLALALSIFFAPSCRMRPGELPVEEKKDTVYPLGFCTDSFAVDSGTVRNSEIFTSLMKRAGMCAEDAYALVLASDSVFDSRRMRAGNGWQAYYSSDTAGQRVLEYFVYEQDRVNMTVFDCTPPYSAWTAAKPVETVRRYADVTINSSLWNDMIAAGVSPLMIVELSEIYAWTIDFFALQPGDRFRVIYEQNVCEGDVIDIEKVHIADFEHDGKSFPAVYFSQNDSGNVYWNDKGESMRKAFLKAPLEFTRVSSGFSYRRRNPVDGVVRPHTGVDYAAPTGTPVKSIGDGTVISRGWSGAGGNTVKIRHNSVYTTGYMHLSRYAAGLKVGDRVRQGEVIGYVGSTGRSTGPHLDFRVWMNGTPINPLKMESPPTDPLKEEFRAAFDSVVVVMKNELDSLTMNL